MNHQALSSILARLGRYCLAFGFIKHAFPSSQQKLIMYGFSRNKLFVKSVEMSEGEFYTGGFVLCNFNETVTLAHYAWPPWDQIDVRLSIIIINVYINRHRQ